MREPAENWPPLSHILQELPVAYTEVDVRGTLRAANKEACRLMGIIAEEWIGQEVWEFVPHDEADRDRAEFLRTVEADGDPPVIRRSILSKGEFRTHEMHRRMLRDGEGNPIGMGCATFDVSELDAAHQEAKQAKLWLESVVQAIPQAVIVTDALGFVRFANPSAELLTGCPVQEQVGSQVEKVIPILRVVSANRSVPSFRMALHEPWNGDVEILNRSGEAMTLWLSASPIIDRESGYTNGVVIVMPSPRARVRHPKEPNSPAQEVEQDRRPIEA
jgi:PAS domain S-box-containing protein